MAIVIQNDFHRASGPKQEYVPYPGPVIDPYIGPLHPERFTRQENVFSNAAESVPGADIENDSLPVVVETPSTLDRIFQGLGIISELYTTIKYPDGSTEKIIETEITPGYEDRAGLQPVHYVAILAGVVIVGLIALKLKPAKE